MGLSIVSRIRREAGFGRRVRAPRGGTSDIRLVSHDSQGLQQQYRNEYSTNLKVTPLFSTLKLSLIIGIIQVSDHRSLEVVIVQAPEGE
jgi:hypothetical protein